MKKIFNKKFKKARTKIFCFQIVFCLLISTIPVQYLFASADDNIYAGGSGTENDPYLISNVDQLYAMSEDFDANTNSDVVGHYKLTNDIVFNDTTNFSNWKTNAPKNHWLHKGFYRDWNKRKNFAGSFDGNGYKIIGLYINNTDENLDTGFISTSTGTIKNVHFEKAFVKGKINTGGIVGLAADRCKVVNCSFSGVVEGSKYIGGIVGRYYFVMGEDKKLVVNSCSFEGKVSATSVAAGGILGDVSTYASGINPSVDIINCYAAANVSGDIRTGGLIGRINTTNVKSTANIVKSYFYGTLGSNSMGTIIGNTTGTYTISLKDVYYNSDIIGGATNKNIQGVGKTTEEFSKGNVNDLLNNSEATEAAYWEWRQGEKYPIENRAHLNDLTLSIGDLEFIPTAYDYKITLPYDNKAVTIIPAVAYSSNKVTVDGKDVKSGEKSQLINLEAGKTKDVAVKVKDSDGSEATYQLHIMRKLEVKYAGGKGTAGDPYLISNADQLIKMAEDFEKNDRLDISTCFKLTNDIVFNDTSDFDNWGTQAPANKWLHKSFWRDWNKRHDWCGTFDGAGYKIIGLYINNQDTAFDTGFIGATAGNALIKDLHFEKSYVKGGAQTGTIVGQASYDTSIIGCSVNGIVEGSKYIGGLVGRYYYCMGDPRKLTIESCSFDGKVTSTSVVAGGILGDITTYAKDCDPSLDVINCYVVADINGDSRTGGLIGRDATTKSASTINIVNSYYYGTLSNTAKGTILGETANNSKITYKDVFYNSDIIGGARNKKIQGIGKTSTAFSNGTVTELLINSKAVEGRHWDWRQGEKYPIEKKARLNSIVFSSGSFKYSLSVYEYKISLANKVDVISLYPVAAYDTSKITIDGESVNSSEYSQEINLIPGVMRNVTVNVKDEDGSESTYLLHITRRVAKSEPSVWDGTVAEDYEGGAGTLDDPFVIINASQLAYFAQDINSNFASGENKYYVLENDIILNSNYANYESWGTEAPTNVWTPISKYDENKLNETFKGSFNGQGHTIYGLYTDGSTGNNGTGLFGAVNGGTISNLNIKDSYLKASGRVGGILGVAVGQTGTVQIVNVGFKGIIEANGTSVGGIVGESVTFPTGAINVYSSYSLGKITGKSNVGGLIGYVFNERTIGNGDITIRVENSYSGMKIEQIKNSGNYFGGIIGCFSGKDEQISLYIRKSHFAGNISSTATKKGPVLGGFEEENGAINIEGNVYYSKDSVASPITDQFSAIGFNSESFTDGTVLKLLTNLKRNYQSDLWNWIQGDKYPISPAQNPILKDISLSAGSITFNPTISEYSIWVDKSIKNINVTPVASNANFKITVNGIKVNSAESSQSITLNSNGTTVITIVVTDENDVSQTITLRIHNGEYMLYFIQGNGIDSGEFGQEIKLQANKEHTFSFNYFVRTVNGLRPLVKYINNKGEWAYLDSLPEKLEKIREVKFTFDIVTPNNALVDSAGKVTYKIGLMKDKSSVGYVANLKLTEKGTDNNLLKNSNFRENFMNWIDLKDEKYMTDNVFVGYLGEVKLLPIVSEYFAEKPNDTNDEMFNDLDWYIADDFEDIDFIYDDSNFDGDEYDLSEDFTEQDNGSQKTDKNVINNKNKNKNKKNLAEAENNTYIYIFIIAGIVVLAGVTLLIVILKKRKK